MRNMTRHPGMPRRRLSAAVLTGILTGVIPGLCAGAETDKSRLLGTCAEEKFEFTEKVRLAFLRYAQSKARSDLKARGKTIPDAFLAWIDSKPEIKAGVYAGHDSPADVLLHLYALSLDLGKSRFEKYPQLALAAAVVGAKQALGADLSPRKPLKIAIPGDPRKPVDTKAKGRKLDRNDHIINFLNEHEIEEEIVTGYKEEVPELKYDDRGKAIPAPKGKKPKKVPILEKRKRSLYACDVLANRELQVKFNAYMKAKGHPVDIDCGDRVIHWKSRDAVKGQQRKDIAAAYKLFREAYEAKGLIPAHRDPLPTLAERCAYLIRNNEHVFSPGVRDEREWPRFPLNSPWPVMTLLVDDDQPLREREERWLAFRDKGEFKKYGEYIGGIAQQFDMQSARRLKPYPFTYHTVQMMLKDGGVCGTMASISARSHITLGMPACQAIQPGHCAMIAYYYDAKKKTYRCKGGQYATGGDEKTTPFARWYFGDAAKHYERRPGFGVQPNPRKPMVYHQAVAWAINHGFMAFLDSIMAYSVHGLLEVTERNADGRSLLISGLAVNPYNILLADAAVETARTPQDLIAFRRLFHEALKSGAEKSGCPADGLYAKTVLKKVFVGLAKLEVPDDKKAAGKIHAFLKEQQCDVPEALVIYQAAAEGVPALLAATEASFKIHLIDTRKTGSEKNDMACRNMADTLKKTATYVTDREKRKQWALGLLSHASGREMYFGRWMNVRTDPAVTFLAKQAGQRMPDHAQLMQSLLDRLTVDLKASVGGPREIKACKTLAEMIRAAAKHAMDANVKRAWIEALSKIIAGKESFTPKSRRKHAKPVRDPCADAIKGLLADPKA
jgi:hypothetical protein